MLLFGVGFRIFDDQLLFASHIALQVDDAIDLRNLCRILRTTGFEKLCHTRKTTRDILCLSDFSWSLGHSLPGLNFLSILHLDMCPRGNTISRNNCACSIHNRNLRMKILFVLDDHGADRLGGLIHLLLHRHPFKNILKLHSPGFLRKNRDIIWIPLNEALAFLDLAPFWNRDH